jgi:hypothetical protein
MPGVELSISSCDGHVVVALRGELDVSAEAASRLTISPARPSGGLVGASRAVQLTDVARDFVSGATAEFRSPARHQPHR